MENNGPRGGVTSLELWAAQERASRLRLRAKLDEREVTGVALEEILERVRQLPVAIEALLNGGDPDEVADDLRELVYEGSQLRRELGQVESITRRLGFWLHDARQYPLWTPEQQLASVAR